MWSDAPLLIFKASPTRKLMESLIMCASVFGFFSYLSAMVQNYMLLPIWFSLKYKLGQWVPKQQYCSQSIPQCTETISFWVSNAALWKSMQLLGQHHLIVLPVLQFPGFALFLALDSLPKLLVILYVTTGLLFHFWVGFFLLFICKCLFLENWQWQ